MRSRLFKTLNSHERRQLNRLRGFMPNRESQLARLRDLASVRENQIDYLWSLTPRKQRQVERLREFVPTKHRRGRRQNQQRHSHPLLTLLARHPWIWWALTWLLFVAMAGMAWMVLMNPSFSKLPVAPPQGSESVAREENLSLWLFAALVPICAITSLALSRWLRESPKRSPKPGRRERRRSRRTRRRSFRHH